MADEAFDPVHADMLSSGSEATDASDDGATAAAADAVGDSAGDEHGDEAEAESPTMSSTLSPASNTSSVSPGTHRNRSREEMLLQSMLNDHGLSSGRRGERVAWEALRDGGGSDGRRDGRGYVPSDDATTPDQPRVASLGPVDTGDGWCVIYACVIGEYAFLSQRYSKFSKAIKDALADAERATPEPFARLTTLAHRVSTLPPFANRAAVGDKRAQMLQDGINQALEPAQGAADSSDSDISATTDASGASSPVSPPVTVVSGGAGGEGDAAAAAAATPTTTAPDVAVAARSESRRSLMCLLRPLDGIRTVFRAAPEGLAVAQGRAIATFDLLREWTRTLTALATRYEEAPTTLRRAVVRGHAASDGRWLEELARWREQHKKLAEDTAAFMQWYGARDAIVGGVRKDLLLLHDALSLKIGEWSQERGDDGGDAKERLQRHDGSVVHLRAVLDAGRQALWAAATRLVTAAAGRKPLVRLRDLVATATSKADAVVARAGRRAPKVAAHFAAKRRHASPPPSKAEEAETQPTKQKEEEELREAVARGVPDLDSLADAGLPPEFAKCEHVRAISDCCDRRVAASLNVTDMVPDDSDCPEVDLAYEVTDRLLSGVAKMKVKAEKSPELSKRAADADSALAAVLAAATSAQVAGAREVQRKAIDKVRKSDTPSSTDVDPAAFDAPRTALHAKLELIRVVGAVDAGVVAATKSLRAHCAGLLKWHSPEEELRRDTERKQAASVPRRSRATTGAAARAASGHSDIPTSDSEADASSDGGDESKTTATTATSAPITIAGAHADAFSEDEEEVARERRRTANRYRRKFHAKVPTHGGAGGSYPRRSSSTARAILAGLSPGSGDRADIEHRPGDGCPAGSWDREPGSEEGSAAAGGDSVASWMAARARESVGGGSRTLRVGTREITLHGPSVEM